MDITEVFDIWRNEIETELEEAQSALIAAETELHNAIAAEATARADHAKIVAALSRVGARRPLANALARRRHVPDEVVREAQSRLARASRLIESSHQGIKDLHSALAQIDEIVAQPVPVAA
jgi:hypothetical protein